MIFLDSASMHPVLSVARAAFNSAPFGNPSSEHAVGQAARNALEDARKRIARLLDCGSSEIYFVSSATEAAALAIHSLGVAKYDFHPTSIEHHAIGEPIRFAEAVYEKSHSIREVYGMAYAWMLANNETGDLLLQPDKMFSDVWLCDATAAVGHIPVSFRTLGADYLLFDGLKFGSVPGAAALIAKDGAPLSPLIRGGGQERGMRSGTENVPAICAMAAALEWQTEHMMENTEHINSLFSLMYDLLNQIPDHQWNTPLRLPILPHILNISFKGVNGKALALLLSKSGVMVSAGAACSNGLNEPSHVLMAMFNDEDRARSAIRISFSHENTEAEVEEAAAKIKDAVEFLRSVS